MKIPEDPVFSTRYNRCFFLIFFDGCTGTTKYNQNFKYVSLALRNTNINILEPKENIKKKFWFYLVPGTTVEKKNIGCTWY